MSHSSSRISPRVWFGRSPEVLLIAVASIQIALATGGDLLAWKGGGFGMFARLDGVGLREVLVTGETGRPVEVSSDFYALERRCRTYPSASCLRELADAIQAAGQRAARIEVWRTQFDGDPLRPHRERIATLNLRPEPAE